MNPFRSIAGRSGFRRSTKVNLGGLFLQIMVDGNNEGNNFESKEDWDCEQEEFTK